MKIEEYYHLKSVFESLWGKDTYSRLKHCSNISVWKRYSERTLKASLMAIQETVKVSDDQWCAKADNIIKAGLESIRLSRSFDELFSSLSATYIELSFHQIGLMPSRILTESRLEKRYWKLDAFRTIQYIQTKEQKSDLENLIKRNKLRSEEIISRSKNK